VTKLSIRDLKREVAHLIALRPDADITFYQSKSPCAMWVKQVVFTNAHRDSLSLKL
jgi:putative hydrolase of the HAD superfamily